MSQLKKSHNPLMHFGVAVADSTTTRFYTLSLALIIC